MPTDHLGTLCHQSFKRYSSRLFNSLPIHISLIRNLTNCPVSVFKSHLDKFFQNIADNPCVPYEENSLSGRLAGVYSQCTGLEE